VLKLIRFINALAQPDTLVLTAKNRNHVKTTRAKVGRTTLMSLKSSSVTRIIRMVFRETKDF
jgi:hypothetical protein